MMNDLKFTTAGSYMEEDLVYRLRKRAEIRRQIPTRKSVQDNQPDRISDLLEEAATEIEKLRGNNISAGIDRNTIIFSEYDIGTEEGYNAFVKSRNKE
jgi:hypothetical protein